ncbi:helicase-related protein, partial [Cylindrospermopsis raciborskii]|uniref:helicase-related protein n=1 Tax=Cylindrospermopsis raciborskii TaxID=77022 RepID=UPI0038D2597D
MKMIKPGSIVSCRNREWVVLPDPDPDLVVLLPLSGNEEEIVGIYSELGLETLNPASFPLPDPENIPEDKLQDLEGGGLLMDAGRFLLRSGAGPFRCLGRLGFSPRPYQLVPLLMALRLSTVRLLIADDVGIGKTIEASLIARELLDRGEIGRIGVLSPPHLCDQWQKELMEKFHIDAVVIRSGTVSRLERSVPPGVSIFEYYNHIIVSLDYAKSDKRRESFLVHCPDLVIVDEAHTCTRSQSNTEQQRHQLISSIAKKSSHHLILVTATPHSGIEESFLSLLGFLNPEFRDFNLDDLSEKQKEQLANHLIQRRRGDIKQWLGTETPFPERESQERSYKLSLEYQDLFKDVYEFAINIVKSITEDMSYGQKKGCYWSALALIRCVMSSPAAAIATLQKSEQREEEEQREPDNEMMSAYVYDTLEMEQSVDTAPTIVVEQRKYKAAERKKLNSFIERAKLLEGNKDQKLQSCLIYVQQLLAENYHPIIWCRYIATAEYVAEKIRDLLEIKSPFYRVIAITGKQSEEEREVRLEELKSYQKRVLVATDCLSEGINLQSHFNAVIHYDLPWNPNRLEQREGRIDRYGQTARKVKTCLLYGKDNEVDGAVLDVLIRKAVEIHKTLGITVPVPMSSTNVAEAVFKSLLNKSPLQLSLLLDITEKESTQVQVHKQWDKAIEREKISRTRFAQRSIKPTEIEQEIIETESVLGNGEDLKRFVIRSCERLNCGISKQKNGWLLQSIPSWLEEIIGKKGKLIISFIPPIEEDIEYITRNHPFVEGIARYIMETVLNSDKNALAT